MGDRTVDEIRTHFACRAATPEFVQIDQKPGVPGRHYSTPEMIALERENVRMMREAQGQRPPLASADIRRDIQDHYPHLNAGQLAAVERVLNSRDGVQELDGVAGAGKTTALAAIRDAAERAGYRVAGVRADVAGGADARRGRHRIEDAAAAPGAAARRRRAPPAASVCPRRIEPRQHRRRCTSS